MLVDAIGKQMAAHGGIGLAAPVFNAMLQAQEQTTMTKDLIAAGTVLAETLQTENAALAALDLPRAAGMLADKQRAAAGFVAAQADPIGRRAARCGRTHGAAAAGAGDGEQAPAGTCDRRAGQGDRRRSRAPPTAATEPAGYGAAPIRGRRPVAFALSARA